MKKTIIFAIFLLSFTSCSQKQDGNTSNEIIVDSLAKSRIDSTLQSFVDSKLIAGVSTLIFEKGEEAHFSSFGYRDREEQDELERSDIAMIYSMTKPLTGVALMTLYEEGKFDLDDPLSKYAPEFGDMEVYTGVDENGELITEPQNRPISIRDLTRHTAGFINDTTTPGLGEMNAKLDIRSQENTLKTLSKKLSSIPLLFQPGTQWEYGMCVDIQAYLVELISGVPFQKYLRENVLNPLGMSETRYFVPENDRKRMMAVYTISEDSLSRIPNERAHISHTKQWPLFRGGSGLTSTLDDYMKFAQMLVNEGSLKGVKILEPETVKLMATNHLSEDIEERSWLPGKGQVGFGIDFAVRLRPAQSAEEKVGIVGEFFWDGAASTLFWVDPVNELTAVLFVQLFPFDPIGLHKNFKDAVYGPYIPESN